MSLAPILRPNLFDHPAASDTLNLSLLLSTHLSLRFEDTFPSPTYPERESLRT